MLYNFKSDGAFANGSLFDNVTNTGISVYATRVETQGTRPRTTTASTYFGYSKCQYFSWGYHCDSLSGLVGNGGLAGDARSGLVLNVATANEPGLVYCFSEYNSATGQSQFECPPGPLPNALQGNISITFTKSGDFWSRFTGVYQTHYTNFSYRSVGTSTSFSATMTGNILAVPIGQPGWSQWSGIGTNEGVSLAVQIGPSQ